MFLDGGATVFGVLGAAGAALGIRQKKRDGVDLAVDRDEVTVLHTELRAAQLEVTEHHQALTVAWRGPLSLFEDAQAQEAVARGVPRWAVSCVCKARRLTETASELMDLGDVYSAQLAVAHREGRGLLHRHVTDLTGRLGELALELLEHLVYLEAARAAFDAPGAQRLPQDDVLGEAISGFSSSREQRPLPVAVLRDRGRLGELLRAQEDAVGAVLRALDITAEGKASDAAPCELAPWAAGWLADDPMSEPEVKPPAL